MIWSAKGDFLILPKTLINLQSVCFVWFWLNSCFKIKVNLFKKNHCPTIPISSFSMSSDGSLEMEKQNGNNINECQIDILVISVYFVLFFLRLFTVSIFYLAKLNLNQNECNFIIKPHKQFDNYFFAWEQFYTTTYINLMLTLLWDIDFDFNYWAS